MFCAVTLWFVLRVIKPEEGKKLADSWGAAFMESSAKENEVLFLSQEVNKEYSHQS